MVRVEIGSILKRRSGDGPKTIEVVGSHAGEWITTNADEFASAEAWTPNDLRTCYGADGQDAASVDEIDLFSTESARQAFTDKLAESRQKAQIVEYETQRDALPVEAIFAMSEDEQAELREKKAKNIERRLAEAKLEY
jgi:hypothetical protein